MTEKELKKLGRRDLLLLLMDQTRENMRLKEENETLKKQLEDRNLRIGESGTLAEAALKLSRVFEEADRAAAIYLENIKSRAEAGNAPEEEKAEDKPE